MAAQREGAPALTVPADRPLIGIPDRVDGRDVVRYYTSDEEADAATSEDGSRRALAAIGAWRDLDLDEMLDELDRIRHESTPTPPIDPEP